MATFSIITKRSNKEQNDLSKQPTFIRFNHSKLQKDFAIGESIPPLLFKDDKKFLKTLKSKNEEAYYKEVHFILESKVKELNILAGNIHLKEKDKREPDFVEYLLNKCYEKGYLKPSNSTPRNGEVKKQENGIGFLECWEKYVELCKKGEVDKANANTQGSLLAEGTIELRENALKKFKEFFTEENIIVNTFDDLTQDILMKFSKWNFKKKNHKGKPNSNRYVNSLLLNLNVFMIWATDKGYNKNNNWKIKRWREPSDDDNIFALSIEQIIKLVAYKPALKNDNDQTQLYVDLAIWQTGTCMAINEVGELRVGDITLKNGKYFLNYRRIKTNKGNIEVLLTKLSLPIYLKYKQGKNDDDLLFTTTQGKSFHANHYNKALKTIAKDLQFDNKVEWVDWVEKEQITLQKPLFEVVSTHSFRKSGISMMINFKMDPDLVKTISGHKANSTSFTRYIKRFDATKIEELEKVMDKYDVFEINVNTSKNYIHKSA